MIEELRISNLGVVANAELAFGSGLNVLTGETGAGKTMIINALTLSLGAKSDSTMVRESAEKLTVESIWQLSAEQKRHVSAVVDDEVELELILGKSIDKTGKSRVVLNGLGSTNSQVSDVAEHLIQIFGQNDQKFLLQPTWQLDTLDNFGKKDHLKALQDYQKAFRACVQFNTQLHDLKQKQLNWAQSRERLRLDLAEFDEISPSPDEDEEILLRIAQKEQSESTASELNEMSQLLAKDDGNSILSDLKRLIILVNRIEIFASYRDDLADLIGTLNEIERELLAALALTVDEVSLSDLYSRKADLNRLIRKHGMSLAEISIQMSNAREMLAGDIDPAAEIVRLEIELGQAEVELCKTASALTHARRKTADLLADLVTAELVQLKMPGIRFAVSVSTKLRASQMQIADRNFDHTGEDVIEFQIAYGEGAPRPIAKSASGGELSRIMLALQVVLQDKSSNLTFVFDEVDAGIGGETAIEVGRRLAKLAQHNQVLVVTHLPQVAAFADHHFSVQGDLSQGVKTSDVKLLSDSEREIEIARMLGGIKDSQAALAHSRELLALRS